MHEMVKFEHDNDGEIDSFPSCGHKKELLIKYIDPLLKDLVPVQKAMSGDCGFDLYNAQNKVVTVPPNCSVNIPAGVCIKIPDGYFGYIVPRSSTFTRKRLLVIPGIIDSGYTGPLFTLAYNISLNNNSYPAVVEPFERISQILILPVPDIQVKVVNELPPTVRGEKGFGSTGR